jgi:predicted hydrocarbon binding protein
MQAEVIKAALDEVKLKQGTQGCRNIMRPCGHQCISDNIITIAKDLYQESKQDLNKFLELMNERHIGGGKLHMEDGYIIGIYETCYCKIPMIIKNVPMEYCECSAGWFERLFSETLGKMVEVEIIQTILSGGEQCSFRIII